MTDRRGPASRQVRLRVRAYSATTRDGADQLVMMDRRGPSSCRMGLRVRAYSAATRYYPL